MMLLRIKRKLSEAMPNEYDFKNKKFKHCKTISTISIPSEYKGLQIQNIQSTTDLKHDSFIDLDIDISNLNFDDTYVYDYYMVEDEYMNYPSSSSTASEIDYPEEIQDSIDDEEYGQSFNGKDNSWVDEDRHRFSELSTSMNSDSSHIWSRESESVVLDFNSSDFDEMNDLLY